jgi:hypothetical protein
LLDPYVVLPVIPKIILVHKPLAQTEAKISQSDLLWGVVKTHPSVVGAPVLFTVNEKPKEMAVRPPHG